MAKPRHLRLSKRVVDRLPVDGGDIVFWDRELPGFGVRVYPSGRKVCVVKTRHNGRSRRVAMGRHGDIPSDQVRNEATKIIARLKAGPPGRGRTRGPTSFGIGLLVHHHLALDNQQFPLKSYSNKINGLRLPQKNTFRKLFWPVSDKQP